MVRIVVRLPVVLRDARGPLVLWHDGARPVAARPGSDPVPWIDGVDSYVGTPAVVPDLHGDGVPELVTSFNRDGVRHLVTFYSPYEL